LGQAILIDKLQQCKAENEQMVQQIEKLKARIANSTQDYVSAADSRH
jgi:cell division septum initiation protein DivIVA